MTVIGLLYDLPEDLPAGTDGHKLGNDAFPQATVDLVRGLLCDYGLEVVEIPSTRQLMSLAASGITKLISGCLNLSSGVPARFRLGHAPMLLEMLGVPYSNSDPFVTLLCRDKARCKSHLDSEGIDTAPGLFIKEPYASLIDGIAARNFPLIVKPNFEGSSIGIDDPIAASPVALAKMVQEKLRHYPDGLLAEAFIEGAEVTCLLIGNGSDLDAYVLSMTNLDGSLLEGSFIYDYRIKESNVEKARYVWNNGSLVIGDEVARDVARTSRRVFEVLGLRDLARLDFRVSEEGRVVFLEANSHPIIEPGNSIFQRLAALRGWAPGEPERRFVATALHRMKLL